MKVYIKKYIKSEADLPKKAGFYFVGCKSVYGTFPEDVYTWEENPSEHDIDYWLNTFDWYIEEREIPDEMEIHKIAQNYNAKHNGGGQSFQDGANFILNKLK